MIQILNPMAFLLASFCFCVTSASANEKSLVHHPPYKQNASHVLRLIKAPISISQFELKHCNLIHCVRIKANTAEGSRLLPGLSLGPAQIRIYKKNSDLIFDDLSGDIYFDVKGNELYIRQLAKDPHSEYIYKLATGELVRFEI